jgi:hypothetical protein
MHREIGLTAQKSVFKLLGKQPFAPLFFQGPLGALVAGGDNPQQLDLDAQRHAQVSGDLLGLGECKRAFAGGESKQGRFHEIGDAEI